MTAAKSDIAVIVPALGEAVTEATITRWLKAVGDAVEFDEPLLVVATDKVDAEIPLPDPGFRTVILEPEDIVSDEEVDGVELPTTPGSAIYDIGGTDLAPRVPNEGTKPDYSSFYPSTIVQFRSRFATFPPEHLEDDERGMHCLQTVDVGIMLSGELQIEVDDGVLTTLGPGDVVVQNGVRHAWRNYSGQPCANAFFMVGADPV